MKQQNPTRRFSAIAAALSAVLFLAACATDDSSPTSTEDEASLAAYGLEEASGREIVEELETMPLEERPTDFIASVETETVEIMDQSGTAASVPLPEDEFYLSVAPYIEQTHECYFHSLTTCVGELGEEEFDVTVTDEETGEVLVEETVQTQDNGFLGLWLPRDIDAELTIEHNDLTSTTPISTSEGDPTCLTTSQLA